MKITNSFYALGLAVMAILLASPPVAASISDLLEMSEKMDKADKQDLLTILDKANDCTRARNFSCSEEHLRKAAKLANGNKDKLALNTATQNLQAEKQRVREEALAKAEQERQIRLAEERREEARRKEAREEEEQAEERRRRAQRERDDEESTPAPTFAQEMQKKLDFYAGLNKIHNESMQDINKIVEERKANERAVREQKERNERAAAEQRAEERASQRAAENRRAQESERIRQQNQASQQQERERQQEQARQQEQTRRRAEAENAKLAEQEAEKSRQSNGGQIRLAQQTATAGSGSSSTVQKHEAFKPAISFSQGASPDYACRKEAMDLDKPHQGDLQGNQGDGISIACRKEEAGHTGPFSAAEQSRTCSGLKQSILAKGGEQIKDFGCGCNLISGEGYVDSSDNFTTCSYFMISQVRWRGKSSVGGAVAR